MSLLIVHVHVRVKPGTEAAFCEATRANASESVQEPGVVRFDVIQQQDDPARFVLVEIYRDEAAAAAHKLTPHYLTWRDAVAGMMEEPRRSARFSNVFPEDGGW
jgi:autoinducer 2-degrading protein